jgi:hypothetical protein
VLSAVAGALGVTVAGAIKAMTDWAAVIVVSGSAKPARLAHVAAAADEAAMPKSEVTSAVESTLAAPRRLLTGSKGRRFA